MRNVRYRAATVENGGSRPGGNSLRRPTRGSRYAPALNQGLHISVWSEGANYLLQGPTFCSSVGWTKGTAHPASLRSAKIEGIYLPVQFGVDDGDKRIVWEKIIRENEKWPSQML